MTAIDPKEIRAGDRVQRTVTIRDVPLIVTEIGPSTLKNALGVTFPFGSKPLSLNISYTWELLDRPAPEPLDGSKWKPADGGSNRWVYDATNHRYILWRANPGNRFLGVGGVCSAVYFTNGFLIPDES